MYDLAGKVALVTGASNKRGIGRGIALRLAREGANVIVNDIHKSPEHIDLWDGEEGWRGLDSLVEEIESLGCRSLACTADVSNSLEVSAMIRQAVEKLGKIDILVNNAALVARDIGIAPVVDMSEEAWNRAIAINLTGVFIMSKAVVGQLIRQGGGGKIINISSLMGKIAMPGRAAYSASKFGIIGLTQALAQEVASQNINVNAVCPGSTATWGSKGQAIYEAVRSGLSEEEAVAKVYADAGSVAQIPLGRPAKVEDVANLVAFLASDQSDYMTGQAVNVTGGRLMAH